MKRVQEVSDKTFEEVKKLMMEEDENEPSFDYVFDIALEVEKRKRDYGFVSTVDAFYDMYY